VSRSRDAEYTEYVAARLSSLRRLAAVLCDDWQRADDLVQATLVSLSGTVTDSPAAGFHWGWRGIGHPCRIATAESPVTDRSHEAESRAMIQ
jgi:hypothetical protein